MLRPTRAATGASLRSLSSPLPPAARRLTTTAALTSIPAPQASSSSAPTVTPARRILAPNHGLLRSRPSTSKRLFATTPRRRNPTTKKETKPYLLADVGEGITECEIVKWFVKAGETVQEFDPICEVQSDKASVEITSRYAGVVSRLMYAEGDVARVGTALCEIEVESEAEEGEAEGIEAAVQPTRSADPQGGPSTVAGQKDVQLDGFIATPKEERRRDVEVLATPAVRRVSREHNVDLHLVTGTGKDGRITKDDVLRYVQDPSASSRSSASASAEEATPSPAHTPASSPYPPADSSSSAAAPPQVLDLSPTRRAMFRAMTSTLAIPHFAYSDEVDVTALEAIRLQLSHSIPLRYRKTLPPSSPSDLDRVAEASRFDKLTLLPLLLKALSLAMADHPLFRSTLSLPTSPSPSPDAKTQAAGAKLHQRSTHDISIALSSPSGLLTPCLSSVDTHSVFDISAAVVRLQTLSSSKGGLAPSDLRATGTVTLSNIGAMGGGTYTHPLIPPTGQLAIGALGRSRFQPRFFSDVPGAAPKSDEEADSIVKRLIMPVSFTGDHRVLEGVELARFVARWKQLVEMPQLWFGLLK